MKQQQIYRKIDQEHPRFHTDDVTSQALEYFSPQETFIHKNILNKPFLQRNFDIQKSPRMSYSILYALLKHIEKHPIPIPVELKNKDLNEKIRLLRLFLLKHYKDDLEELKKTDYQAYISIAQRNIANIWKPIKGIGIDDSGDILLLARYFRIRIYVYHPETKTWKNYIPTNARIISTPDGNQIYYYKERVVGNVFLMQNSKNTFDVMYPKLNLVQKEVPKEIKLKSILLKKKVPSKKPKLPLKKPTPVEGQQKKLQKSILQPPKRCPKGTRRNKETGVCEPTKKIQTESKTQKKSEEKMKRCPKGTRRNKTTGECEPTKKVEAESKEQKLPKEKMKRCPKGTRRNKNTGECEPTKIAE